MAAKNDPAFAKEDLLGIGRAILSRGSTCDHCLGRQFAQVSTGMTDEDRGKIVRRLLKSPSFRGKCVVCAGIFRKLPGYAETAGKRLAKIEHGTFLVGTLMSSDMIRREEALWEDVGIEHCESIRSELNRELGKLICDITGKDHDPDSPDVTVLLNLEKERLDFVIKPLYVRGKYRKLVRGIPQSKWDKYEETLEDVIAAPFMLATGGDGHSLHASGREDKDARCLGRRPFVLEINNPVRRSLDLDKMRDEVNGSGKAEISGLSFTDRKGVVEVATSRHDKTYLAVVEFEKPVNNLKKLAELAGVVEQRTPTRVAHRRADLVRKRKVLDVSWRKINNKKIELQIKGEAGLYIKELVSGDGGKSKPSVSGLLANPAVVKTLDVIKIWD